MARRWKSIVIAVKLLSFRKERKKKKEKSAEYMYIPPALQHLHHLPGDRVGTKSSGERARD